MCFVKWKWVGKGPCPSPTPGFFFLTLSTVNWWGENGVRGPLKKNPGFTPALSCASYRLAQNEKKSVFHSGYHCCLCLDRKKHCLTCCVCFPLAQKVFSGISLIYQCETLSRTSVFHNVHQLNYIPWAQGVSVCVCVWRVNRAELPEPGLCMEAQGAVYGRYMECEWELDIKLLRVATGRT